MESSDTSLKVLCPACGGDETAEIEARSKSQMSVLSLYLSSFICVLFTVAYIVFAFYGKKLDTPDIIWALILTPWGGAAASRVVGFLAKKK